MTRSVQQSQVLGRVSMTMAEGLLASAGMSVVHRDDQAVAFANGTGLVWVTRDVATGNVLVTGPDLPALPSPPVAEIVALLTASDPRDSLAGLQLARTRSEPALILAAFPHLAHPVPAVAEAAQDWILACLSDGRFLADVELAAALFAMPGWRREKLQMMRWWMKDRPADPALVEGALARALADPDWEIAVTAMLAAGTLRLVGLRRAVARIRLPETKSDGVTHDEARMILALRDAALVRLGGPPGKAVPPGIEEVFEGDPDRLPPGLRDTAAALGQPLPVGVPPEPAPGVVLGPSGPTRPDGTLLTWVPPATYRLGTILVPRGTVPNPPHLVKLARGFYIDSEPRAPLSLDAARAEALRLGGSLPTPDQWEMAARGADGRRYAWGMNAGMPVDLSPLGLAGLSGGPGEWLDPGCDAQPLVAGGAASPVPANRLPCIGSEFRSYRLIMVV